MKIQVANITELGQAAAWLLKNTTDQKVILFKGEMGAGKTTFIKAICEHLGVLDNTSSPTFSIVNEYESPKGPVYHFDFYRLKNEEEAFDLGYEEYFYSGNYCFVEWPEKIANLIPEDALIVQIKILSADSREIEIISN